MSRGWMHHHIETTEWTRVRGYFNQHHLASGIVFSLGITADETNAITGTVWVRLSMESCLYVSKIDGNDGAITLYGTSCV